MKNILKILILILIVSCETKYNYIDSGVANGRFTGTIYEYLQSSSYDWDSTLLMVERAGLERLFQGKEEGYEKITFFGPTNLSILRWMIEQGYDSIEDIPIDVCRELILRHVVGGIHWRDDIPDVGAVILNLVSLDTETLISVASTNIETDNGVVHSLNYSYTLGQL